MKENVEVPELLVSEEFCTVKKAKRNARSRLQSSERSVLELAKLSNSSQQKTKRNISKTIPEKMKELFEPCESFDVQNYVDKLENCFATKISEDSAEKNTYKVSTKKEKLLDITKKWTKTIDTILQRYLPEEVTPKKNKGKLLRKNASQSNLHSLIHENLENDKKIDSIIDFYDFKGQKSVKNQNFGENETVLIFDTINLKECNGQKFEKIDNKTPTKLMTPKNVNTVKKFDAPKKNSSSYQESIRMLADG